MRLELSHKSIGRLLDGQEVTVDGLVVSAHESRDAAYLANATEAKPQPASKNARKSDSRDPFVMTAKRDGTCAANCGEPIHAGERIQWSPRTKEARHATCVPKPY